MRPPLLIVGAARSGTTLLGQMLLGSHPDVLYWAEPAFVWRYGNAYKLHDMLGVEACRPAVRRRIRSAFERKAAERPGALLVEKTPANSYRMPFVLATLPEAKILHVVRDGRQAVRSAREEWRGGSRTALDSASLRRKSTLPRIGAMVGREARWAERYVGPLTPLELPAYLPRISSFLLRQAFHVSWLPWGARFPGIARARRQLGLLGVVALQWHLSVHLTRSSCAHLGPDRYLEVAYERIQSQPEPALRDIARFAGLEATDRWLRGCAATVMPRHTNPGAGLTPGEISEIEAIAGATLIAAGYPLLSAPEARHV